MKSTVVNWAKVGALAAVALAVFAGVGLFVMHPSDGLTDQSGDRYQSPDVNHSPGTTVTYNNPYPPQTFSYRALPLNSKQADGSYQSIFVLDVTHVSADPAHGQIRPKGVLEDSCSLTPSAPMDKNNSGIYVYSASGQTIQRIELTCRTQSQIADDGQLFTYAPSSDSLTIVLRGLPIPPPVITRSTIQG
jgi:hypothetical protein